ncbi:hypothetical protein OSB04_026453 [Centaurea solstitialis]|uniref:Uncharacterized protein n=1 Tax=Centaurea solstitialis TaxID=347529 RepID=A0AA38VVN0_9ASTR|nr:hypothetical protein OSB04_026453 [Centaurea solstitialis]
MIRCNSESFSNAHSSSFDSVSKFDIAVSGRKKHDCYKDGVLGERTSKLACSSKSRWQVFLFGSGSGRFPRNMELSDIKSRQLRQIPSTLPTEKGGGKRLTWLIRVLGCGGGFNFDDAIKVSSLGYVRSFDRRM